jgi:hypothetical protein
MPAYVSSPPSVTSIAPGDSVQVWNAEQPAAGTGGSSASQQIACTRAQMVGAAIIVEGFFSGAPGAFELDVQGSEVDADAQYVTVANGNITTVDATNQDFRFEAALVPKFVRLLMRSRTNAVNVTAYLAER